MEPANIWHILAVLAIPVVIGLLIYAVDKWYQASKPNKKRGKKQWPR